VETRPWGGYQFRFQRLNDDIYSNFNDSGASIPVGFTSADLGDRSPPSARRAALFRTRRSGTGTSGNSFVAVVEFGDTVKARGSDGGWRKAAIPHRSTFNDEAKRYSTGDLRESLFFTSCN